jgi:D-psicose/D-tagatose/L-ribulose 3-epimerase
MYSATGLARPLPTHERAAERARAVDGLREVAGYALQAGVTLAIEPLNRYETDMINTVEQGLALCDAIGVDNVGLMLDTYHLNIEETSIGDAIRLAGERCLHVQASENQRGIPGAGHIPWREVKEALDDIGYAGSIVIESFVPTIEEISRAVSLWRPLASSPDELARQGRDFLAALEGGLA